MRTSLHILDAPEDEGTAGTEDHHLRSAREEDTSVCSTSSSNLRARGPTMDPLLCKIR